MAGTLFFLNSVLALYLIASGLMKRAGYLEVQFLSALMYVLWFLPQAFALLGDETLPAGSLDRVLLMSLCCLAGIWLGWELATRKSATLETFPKIQIRRLVFPVLAITIFAIAMRVAILSQPAEARALGQWTGTLTVLSFFSQVSVVSLVLSIVLIIRRRSIITIALFFANLLLYAAPLLMTFRRAETFEFIFAVLLAMFFLRNWALSRWVVVLGLALGFAFINGVGQLRALSGAYAISEANQIQARVPTVEEVLEIDWFDFSRIREASTISETRNAAIFMDVASQQPAPGLGAGLWNRYVHSYVPAQFLGRDFKEGLYIGYSLEELAFETSAFEAHSGTTSTGFTIVYADFWFFGAFVFFFVAWFMGRIFMDVRMGSIGALTFYVVLLPLSVHGVTHYGYYALVHAPLPLCAAWFAIWYARSSSARDHTSSRHRPRMIKLASEKTGRVRKSEAS